MAEATVTAYTMLYMTVTGTNNDHESVDCPDAQPKYCVEPCIEVNWDGRANSSQTFFKQTPVAMVVPT